MVEEFIMGMPSSVFFKVDHKIAIVIGCDDYKKLRGTAGYESFADLVEAKQDIKIVFAGLRRLSFGRKEIQLLENPTMQEIKIVLNEAQAQIYRNYCEGGYTLLFVYYAGHGLMNTTTYAVTNTGKYPLEKMLRSFARAEGSYVLAVLDCCRQRMDSLATRGNTNNDGENDGIAETIAVNPLDSQENFIITYGCQPSDGVPAKSTLAKAYFGYLRKSATANEAADDSAKQIMLPGCLNFFQNTDGKCEHNIKTAKPVLLEWTDRKNNTNSQYNFGATQDLAKMVQETETQNDAEEELGESAEDHDELFIDQEDLADFFDFTQAIRTADCRIQFSNMRMLQNICLLPNNHLLIEGGLMDQTVEVYQIERDQGDLTEPIHVILSGCRGLNTIVTSDREIFMGFMGTLTEMSCIVQVYNFKYELQKQINTAIQENLFTDLALGVNGKFLVGSHTGGTVSVICLKDDNVQVINEPFGYVESIWSIEVFQNRPAGEPQTIFMPSTNGMFQCILTEGGQFMWCMEQFYPDQNVTNAFLINDDEVLCAIQDGQGSKLVICNLDTKQEKVIIQPDSAVYFLDIARIPSVSQNQLPYFILHTGKGIQIVNTEKQRCYDLAHNKQTNFNVCRSISVQPIDPEDPDQGFWLAQIDNGCSGQMAIKAFDFGSEFITALKQLSQKAQLEQ